jgi:hypothetical protein
MQRSAKTQKPTFSLLHTLGLLNTGEDSCQRFTNCITAAAMADRSIP